MLNDQKRAPGYVGRKTMASTAEGYGSVHSREQKAIIDLASAMMQQVGVVEPKQTLGTSNSKLALG